MSLMQVCLGRRARALACAVSLPVVLALSGCATAHSPDPLESWNRGVFSFNETVDVHVLKPVAEGYVWSSVTLFLQGRLKEGAASTMRVAVNSTLGLGGLIDLATPMRLDRFNEDLGQTLGVWGAPSGAYIVWPLMGPSSVRDSANFVTSMTFSATTLIDGAREDNLARLLNVVSTRAAYLSATDLLDSVALDKYAFTRDAYLQRRQSLIDQGRTPAEVEEEEEAPEPRYDLPETEEEAAAAAEAASAASAPEAAR